MSRERRPAVASPPDDVLRARLAARGGLTRDEAVARANEALAGLRHEFRTRLWEMADAAGVRCRAFDPGKPDFGRELREAYRHAHDIKGTAGTFGFEVAGAVADGLSKVLLKGRRTDPRFLDAVEVHVAALLMVAGRVRAGREETSDRMEATTLLAGLGAVALEVMDPDFREDEGNFDV